MSESRLSETEFWEKVYFEIPLTGIHKCEEAAKQMIALSSLLITIYFGIFSFSDPAKLLEYIPLWARIMGISPLLLWLISLWHAIRVIVPRTEKIAKENISELYKNLSKEKHRLLMTSHFFLIASMLVLLFIAAAYAFYLPIHGA